MLDQCLVVRAIYPKYLLKENYHLSKETYHLSKETYYRGVRAFAGACVQMSARDRDLVKET
jgi:hypothetical protein